MQIKTYHSQFFVLHYSHPKIKNIMLLFDMIGCEGGGVYCSSDYRQQRAPNITNCFFNIIINTIHVLIAIIQSFSLNKGVILGMLLHHMHLLTCLTTIVRTEQICSLSCSSAMMFYNQG